MVCVNEQDMDFAESSDATVASLQRLVDAGKIDVVVHSGDIRSVRVTIS
jgi:hypothetical protein